MCVDAVATSGPQSRAKLVATEGGLELYGTLGDFASSRAQVRYAKRAGLYPWVWGSIRICHFLPGCPQRLRF